jgi:hypothetical protein
LEVSQPIALFFLMLRVPIDLTNVRGDPGTAHVQSHGDCPAVIAAPEKASDVEGADAPERNLAPTCSRRQRTAPDGDALKLE